MERAIIQDKSPGVCGHAPVLLHAADRVLGTIRPYALYFTDKALWNIKPGPIVLRLRAHVLSPHAKNSYVSVPPKDKQIYNYIKSVIPSSPSNLSSHGSVTKAM